MNDEVTTATLDSVFEDGEATTQPELVSETQETSTVENTETTTANAEIKEESKEETADPLPEVKPEPSPSGGKDDQTVPLAAVMAERSKRQAVEAELAELKKTPPAPVPDVLENQSEFVNHLKTDMTQQFNSKLEQQSEFFARREFGDEALDNDLKVFEEIVTTEMYNEVVNSPSPYHAIHEKVEKYQKTKEMENIDEWQAKKEAEIRAKVEAEIKEKTEKEIQEKENLRNAIPTSLAGKPSAGALNGKTYDGPAPIENIIGE